MGPLRGLRVLDLSDDVAGGYCTKILADCGADVIKAEPPEGDPARAGRRVRFAALHANKRSLVLDLTTSAGRDVLDGLLPGVDVVVENLPADLGIVPAELCARHPGLIWVAVTPFGRDGPYAEYAANDLIVQAISGWMFEGGSPDRPPLKTGGEVSAYVTGVAAAVAALGALHHRNGGGGGQVVDVSAMEVLQSTCGYTALATSVTGVPGRGRAGQNYPFAIVPAKDGHVGVNILTPAHWEGLCAFMERPDLLDDPRFGTPLDRAQESAALTALIAEWTVTKTCDELFTANEWRVPITKLPSVAEILESPQHAARGFLVEQDCGELGTLRRPAAPFKMRGVPDVRWGVPAPGEHTKEIVQPRSSGEEASRDAAVAPAAPADSPALAGIRVLDLSMWWAGPFCTQVLGDLGAEVCKVESAQVIDGWRGAGAIPGERWWETSFYFLGANRNKQGITLDLRSQRGRDLFKHLLAESDVVVENYTPRVMDNFGLGYEALRAVKADVILVSLPAYGLTGPWRDYPGFAFPVEEMAGFPQLTGYADDGVPRRWGNAAADAIAGWNGALAALAALEDRRRSGQGQHIDLAQIEALACFLAEPILEYQVSGGIPERLGNGHPVQAPHGVYRAAGDDRWLAVTVTNNAQWRALCRVLEREDWWTDSALATAAGRKANAAILDAGIEAWTAARDPREAMEALQAAGVPAAPVLSSSDLLTDPHLLAREYFAETERPLTGRHTHGILWAHLGRTPIRLRKGAPLLGEDNAGVLRQRLGLDEAALRELEAAGVIGDRPTGAPRI